MSRFDQALRRDPAPLLQALAAAGADVRKPKSFRCPFHDDHHPSAEIRLCKDGVWRFNCYTCQERSLDVYDVRRLTGVEGTKLPPPRRVELSEEPPESDWEALQTRYVSRVVAVELNVLAASLGVSPTALRRLEVGWNGQAWTFPMRDAEMNVVGLARRWPDGHKKFLGHTGIFVPDGGLPEQATQILVAEGTSDVAMLLDMGFVAVGRPSCQGTIEPLLAMLAGAEAVIVGDYDEPKRRNDGTTFRPGQDGAKELADAIVKTKGTAKVLLPLKGKDVREWVKASATAAVIRAVIQNTRPWSR